MTVIIPTRNRPGLTIEAARSVQAQTFPYWRLIVVDDGSDDGTPDAVREAFSDDERVEVLRCPSQVGPTPARQRGLEAATTQWVAHLDSDDRWLPHKLERQFALAQDGVEVVLCWWQWVQPDGSIRKSRQIEGSGRVSPVLSNNMDIPLIRRDVLNGIGGFQPADRPFGNTVANIEFFIRLLARTDVEIVPEVLVQCRDHSGARTSDAMSTKTGADELLAVIEARSADLRGWPDAQAALFATAAGRYLAAGERERGLQLLRQAMRCAANRQRFALAMQYAPFLVRTLAKRR